MFHGLQDLSKVIAFLAFFSLNTSFLCSPRSPLKGARTFARAPRVWAPPHSLGGAKRLQTLLFPWF